MAPGCKVAGGDGSGAAVAARVHVVVDTGGGCAFIFAYPCRLFLPPYRSARFLPKPFKLSFIPLPFSKTPRTFVLLLLEEALTLSIS